MNEALLDTDIFSELTKGLNAAVERHASAYLEAHSRVTISVVTLMGSIRGYAEQGREDKIQGVIAVLPACDVLDMTADDAILAGRIYGLLEEKGLRIGWPDTVHAAIALNHGLEVATGNVAHFERVVALGYPLVITNRRA